MDEARSDIGVVLIGRNEGERLRAALLSVQATPLRVYVDSGSSDGSQALAEEMGFDVVDLPVLPPFTAARARNAGLARLLQIEPLLEFIQMADGDCQVRGGWIEKAISVMKCDPSLAAVFGRRRERLPEASAYNRVCDDEWNVPVGEARSCGGDALYRVAALRGVGGFSGNMIAGEEPDLCFRMRQQGWRILRIDAEMTLHDAAITRFGQWWRRAQRAGHAFAELTWRHGGRGDPHWIRQVVSIALWGGALTISSLAALLGLLLGSQELQYFAGLMIGVCVLQWQRLSLRRWREGWRVRHSVAWAVLLMAAKVAQLQGMIHFAVRTVRGARFELIEYK